MAATKITPEVLLKRSEGIRRAKASPTHRQKMSIIAKNLWRTESYRKKHADHMPWNKMGDEDKIKKECPICKQVFFVVPSHFVRKCCSKKCGNEYKRITPHVNWNPKSLVGTGYRKTLRGIYEGHHFRSSYELAVLYELLQQQKQVQVEPFFIWYQFDGKNRRYFPDMFVDNKLVIEVKPIKMLEQLQNQVKIKALQKHCSINNLNYKIMTETDITLLTNDKIQELITSSHLIITKGIKPCYQRKKQRLQVN